MNLVMKVNKMSKEKLERYGENPHQTAWIEIDESYKGPNIVKKQLHGIPLSYNNIIDANSALEVMLDFYDKNASVVIKHTNPCGLATGDDLTEAFKNAWYGDEVSAFGSIVGYSNELDENTVKLLRGKFVEVLVAPSYSKEALDWIKKQESKEELRVIKTGPLEDTPEFIEEHKIRGGTISQTRDNRLYLCDSIDELLLEPKVIQEPNSGNKYLVGNVTERTFDDDTKGLIEFSIIAGKHTKSNAIILAYEYSKGRYRILGMGAGQPNRKDSVEKLAGPKAQENLMRQYFREQRLCPYITFDKMNRDTKYRNKTFRAIRKYTEHILSSKRVVLFSDAFFPFRDGLDAVADLGVKYVIQPGGSKNDNELIKAADQQGVAMIFTGIRHFKH